MTKSITSAGRRPQDDPSSRDRFESKEKLKHFDKMALGPEPWDVPVGGGLGQSRLLVGRGLSGCRWKTLRTRAFLRASLKGV